MIVIFINLFLKFEFKITKDIINLYNYSFFVNKFVNFVSTFLKYLSKYKKTKFFFLSFHY